MFEPTHLCVVLFRLVENGIFLIDSPQKLSAENYFFKFLGYWLDFTVPEN